MNNVITIILLSIIFLTPILIFAYVAGKALYQIDQIEKEIEEMNKDGKHKE